MADPVTAGLLVGATVLNIKGQRDQTAFESAMASRKASQSQSAGQRGAIEARRQGDRVLSDATASMAASGGVTDDAGAVEQLADIKQVADFNALSALYEGDTRAQGLQIEDNARRKQSKTKQFSTALTGASQIYKVK